MPTVRDKKGNNLLEFPDDYIVVDLETTGFSPLYNNIIEVAAVRVADGVVVDNFQSLINPGHKVSSEITGLTGITNEMLAEEPSISSVLPQFLDYVGDSMIIAHNAHFDINFIYDNCCRALDHFFVNDFICTMRISRRLYREHKRHTLSAIIDRLGVGETVEHRALSDATQTHKCYEIMKRHARENNIILRK